MYIKIGSTNIKYLTSQNDFMIISEVIDSSLSYEKPVLVRTSDELDIWFGRSFTDRDYMSELLETGVTLFLYRPIKDELDSSESNYIDYYSYQENPNIYYNEFELPKVGENNMKYKVVSTIGEIFDTELSVRFNYWIWYNNEYIDTSQLPQNLDLNNTSSLNNRDVLSINYNYCDGPNYVYPSYEDDTDNSYLIDSEYLLKNLPNLDRVNLGYESLCYDIEFSDKIDFGKNKEESSYIVISSKDGKNVLLYFDSGYGIPKSINNKYYDKSLGISINGKSKSDIIKEFIACLDNLGYTTNTILEERRYYTYSSFRTDSRYFYNIDEFSMTPNFDRTYDILSNLTKNDRRIKFTSKTIGADPDNLIKVKIEKLDIDNYRITISRFDYSEVFEGSIFNGSNRIDYKISNESKLVRCDLIENYVNREGISVKYKMDYKDGEDRNPFLPEGEWELRRGKVEDYDNKSYWKSVKSIFNDGDTIMFDFLLVPDIKKYTNGLDPNYDYYTEYVDFLNYSKLINCQILIQNSDSNWNIVDVNSLPNSPESGIVYKIKQEEGGYKFYILNSSGNLEETTDREIINSYGNDYVFNYVDDLENRLIYFYRPMSVLGNDRPAYYVYLDGLFKDSYSASIKYIVYNSPVNDPYSEEDIEIRLEKYKSNYLVDNNQIYYYKKYQNGENFVTTGWMRFCLGKIERELSKNKWKFLSERISGNIKNLILNILNKITNYFSIIRRISLTEFNINYKEYNIELTIEAYMSDLIDNNISLNITLNYNK